jgi:hypothetical protein
MPRPARPDLRPGPFLGAPLAVLALSVAACMSASSAVPAAPAAQPSANSTSSTSVASAVAVTPAPVNAVPTTAAGTAELLHLRVGADRPSSRLQIVDGSTGAIESDVPDGTIDRRTGLVYVATPDGPATQVAAYDIRTARPVRSTTFQGSLTLPTIGNDHTPVGLSGDGATLVLDVGPGLEGKIPGGPTYGELRSRFAIFDTKLDRAPRLVDLAGSFSFDALSPDGRILYLVEHVPADSPTGYQVRAYDVPLGALREGVVVDKTAGSLLMQGTPVSQVRSTSGDWVYTLYRNQANGPFIHALSAVDAFALCLFPSRRPVAADEERAAASWDLVMSPDAKDLYATNGALGMVFAVDTADLGASRTVQLARTVATSSAGAHGAAVSSDGSTLYLAAGDAILKLRSSTLQVAATIPSTADIIALGAGSTGVLYASSRTGLVSLVTDQGITGTMPLGGGPARILWVESRH